MHPSTKKSMRIEGCAINMQRIPSQDIMKPDYKNWIPRGLLFTVFGGVALLFLLKKRKYQGTTAGIYLVLYGVMRFLLEFMRGDHTDSILGLTPSQFSAVFIAIPCGIIVFFTARNLGRKKEKRPADA